MQTLTVLIYKIIKNTKNTEAEDKKGTLLVTITIKFLHTRLTDWCIGSKQNSAHCQSHHMVDATQVADSAFRMLFVLFT